VILTRVVGDADCGDDWPDTARAFIERDVDFRGELTRDFH
jgi:hypothetical protein